MWDSLRLATCVFNMWLLLANIPRLLVALTTITTNRGHSTIMFGSLLIYHWPVNIPIDDCNMSICCSSTDHPPLMTSKVIPKKMFGMVCSAPHTRKKPRNFIKHGNYMQIHAVTSSVNIYQPPYQPFATSATNAYIKLLPQTWLLQTPQVQPKSGYHLLTMSWGNPAYWT